MQKLFEEVSSLDTQCYKKFKLTPDLLMEHAANGMAIYIRNNFSLNSKVTIVIGNGNNGADGLALARLLHSDFKVKVFYAKEPKSPMALLQKERCEALQVQTSAKLNDCDILVDALVGTGFKGEFDTTLSKVIKKMNKLNAFKIACDVPSGFVFYANATLTMGALKKSLYLDKHKEFVGTIEVLNLGVSRTIYETSSNWNLLDLEDLQLPYRDTKNTHKGSYGHLALTYGEKSGASIMSALSALKFGAGLVTLVGFKNETSAHTLMQSHETPSSTSALAIGMGLGEEFSQKELEKFLDNQHPLIGDADIFTMEILKTIVKRKNIVLTPHPKEFVNALKLLNLAIIDIKELQKNRFKYIELFCEKYPNAVLLLKGANVIIGRKNKFFINPHGTSALAKGGSGDVLSGLIGSLLAQGYKPLDATINASLAHAKLALLHKENNFSLTPDNLINNIGNL